MTVRTLFPDGVRLVEAASVHDRRLLAQSVASALGLPDTGEDAPDRVLEFLRDRSVPLVLDIREHLVAACCATEPTASTVSRSRSGGWATGARQPATHWRACASSCGSTT